MLLDYHSKLHSWLNVAINMNLFVLGKEGETHGNVVEQRLNDLYYDFLIAEANFDIYYILEKEVLRKPML